MGSTSGFHGYKTFVLGALVVLGYFLAPLYLTPGTAALVLAGVPGLLIGLATLVGANEAANVFKERAAASGQPTTVLAETAEVTGGPVTVEGSA